MTCDSVRESLPLLEYGEVDVAERVRIEDHLDTCAACRETWEKEQRILRLLDQRLMEPPPGLLGQCRHQFEETMEARSEARRSCGWWQTLAAWAPFANLTWALRPLSALGLVAVGFFGARLMTTSPAIPASLPLPAAFDFPAIDHASVQTLNTVASLPYRIRDIQATTDGRVNVRLEETREIVLTGKVDDEPIQRALLAAFRSSPDPGLRLDSLDMLEERRNTSGLRGVLIQALVSDPSPGVRLRALQALAPQANEKQVRDILAQVVLKDDNPGVRVRAIDLLVEHKEYSIASVLQEVLEHEQNSYVRSRCQDALLDMNASAESF